MSGKHIVNSITGFLILMVMPFIISAQNNFVTKSASVFINGTSTIHDWRSEVTQVNVDGVFDIEGSVFNSINSLKLTIPAIGIISTKGSVMDKKTWNALDYQKHPNITFKMTQVNSLKESPSGYTLDMSGVLTIAGFSRNINLQSECTYLGNNIYEFSGIHPIKMTDYKITPPTALFGTITTADDVTVDYIVKIQMKQ